MTTSCPWITILVKQLFRVTFSKCTEVLLKSSKMNINTECKLGMRFHKTDKLAAVELPYSCVCFVTSIREQCYKLLAFMSLVLRAQCVYRLPITFTISNSVNQCQE